MKRTYNGYPTSPIPKQSMVQTEQGWKSVQHVKINEKIKTPIGTLEIIADIEEATIPHGFQIELYGERPITLSIETSVLARKVTFEDGMPKVDTPKWVKVRQLELNQHLVYVPPEKINKHNFSTKEKIERSAYFDSQKRKWVQIKGISFVEGPISTSVLRFRNVEGIMTETLALK